MCRSYAKELANGAANHVRVAYLSQLLFTLFIFSMRMDVHFARKIRFFNRNTLSTRITIVPYQLNNVLFNFNFSLLFAPEKKVFYNTKQ